MKYLIAFILFPSLLLALLDNISISGNPAQMMISTATAGFSPNSVQNSSTTYSIQTSILGRSIVGQIGTAMPVGLTLSLNLQAPLGGTSLGSVALSTAPKNLVTGLPLLSLLQIGLQMTYTLSATVQAAPLSLSSVVVTLTII